MSRPENVKWVDVSSNNLFVRSLIQKASFLSQSNLTFPQGLRGLASVLVISTHITRGFFLDLMKPTSEVEAPPKLFQYPFLRVLTQGRIGVAIFALVTGYVCALKPIRQIRAGERNAMFNGVSRSAFRRVPRLILPTAIATTITWFFCQFGVFQVAEKADSWWLNFSAPRMTPYIGEAIYSLLLEMIMTWSRGWNMYDHHTWTMLPLLKSSMLVFIFLFAAAYCKTRYRIMLELGLFVYFYISNDCKSYVNPPPLISMLIRGSNFWNALLLWRFPLRSLPRPNPPKLVQRPQMARTTPHPHLLHSWALPRLLPRSRTRLDALVQSNGRLVPLYLPQRKRHATILHRHRPHLRRARNPLLQRGEILPVKQIPALVRQALVRCVPPARLAPALDISVDVFRGPFTERYHS